MIEIAVLLEFTSALLERRSANLITELDLTTNIFLSLQFACLQIFHVYKSFKNTD